MRKEYLVMLDSETGGRVFYANRNELREFASMDELYEHFRLDTEAVHTSVPWNAPVMSRGKLLPLHVMVLYIDADGSHGYVSNGTNKDSFKSDRQLQSIFDARIRTENRRRHIRKTAKAAAALKKRPSPAMQAEANAAQEEPHRHESCKGE